MFGSRDKPLEEKEFPDEADLADADDDVVSLRRCPACDRLVYEQAQQCPYCKEWIGPEDWRQSRKWYVRGGLYLTRTLLINWIFWLVVVLLVTIVAIWELTR